MSACRFAGRRRGRRRSSPRTHHRRDRVHQRFQQQCVVGVGRGQGDRHRQPASVGQQVLRRAGVASVNRVRTGQRAPLFAGTAMLSTLARDQSIEPSSPSQSSSQCAAPSTRRPPANRAAAASRSPGCRSRAPGLGGVARALRCAAGRRRRRAPPVPDPRPPSPRLRPLGGQQRFDRLPQLIRHQLLSSVQRPAAGRIPRHRTQPGTEPRGCETRS